MKTIMSIIFCFITLVAGSQNISISDEANKTADSSAVLDISSTSKGMLIPRMTQAQRESIQSPANSLMVYQTDQNPGFWYFKEEGKSPGWIRITSANDALWTPDSTGQSVVLSDPDNKVGIQTDNPASPLSVGGIIEAMDGGFKFPDGSVQSTASFSPGPEGAGDGRWVVGIWNSDFSGPWNFDDCIGCSKVYDLNWRFFIDLANPQARPSIEPFWIYKDIDKATVNYIRYLFTGQVFQEFWIKFYWQSGVDEYTKYFEIRLEDVMVADFRHIVQNVGNDIYVHMDKISFVVGNKIHWFWIPDNIEYFYNIMMPVR